MAYIYVDLHVWVGDHFTLYIILDQRASPPFYSIHISVFQFHMDFFALFQIISTLENCLNFCRENGILKDHSHVHSATFKWHWLSIILK